MIKTNNTTYLIIPRTISLLFLGGYYFASVKKVNVYFNFVLFFIVLTGSLFALNHYTLLGLFSLFLLRLSLVILLFSQKEKIDKKAIFTIFLLSILIIGIIMGTMFVDTSFFYLSILTTLVLVFLLAVAFSRLLRSNKKDNGNIEMFIAISIFVVSDALSGSQKIGGTQTFYLLLSLCLYNVAYFFMMRSLIKKENAI